MLSTLIALGLALSSAAAADVVAEFSKIVGGNEVTAFSKPYVGALTTRDSAFHFCGVSLISATAAVTAAHCVLFGAKFDVWFARHNETLAAVDEGAVRRQVEQVRVHPRYQPYTNEFDFALLLWSAPVRVHTVRVFFGPREQVTGLYATSAGWGATAENGPQSDVLRAVSGMELWTLDRCSEALNYSVSESMVCAGGQAGRDACQGDSGGPLLVDNTDLLVGCVSWGLGCAREGLPGVYSFLAAAEDWIRELVELPH
jgi:secreted trypsin-like serine protease